MFVGVTVEKLVGGPSLFKTFIKVKYTLSEKISSGKSFRWGKFLSSSEHFIFPDEGNFPQI